MNIVGINTGNVYSSIGNFKEYIEKLSNPKNAVYARIRYNTNKLIKPYGIRLRRYSSAKKNNKTRYSKRRIYFRSKFQAIQISNRGI